MDTIVIYIAGAIFLVGVLLRILFALFYPDRFAEGAKEMLFIEERQKKLFRAVKGTKNNKGWTD